ncbi:sugar phosphate isomerase/epimerase [Salipaludibacillus sp. CUR1]|uniref:sugar phosphate isomerase/epimerase family protein n=1 Tax=Salipaludibacillus sp. CUR1 TaxID=2820003 RepID=UPI001E438709|nr:sugar phosphate isomerase/epimerase [Salipaludibacillus sp. CUR1]MCE7793940.1 sugar phosphate isomerase/epimerase [Salipaludibacillus sp. CUR1]
MEKPQIAVQLFTLREEMAKDPKGTLRRVAELGFDGVEFAGYSGLTVEETKQTIDELGLKAAASHVPLEDLKENLSGVIEDQKVLGSRYLVVPFLEENEQTEEGYLSLIAFLQEAGKTCREQGITLCYHNHDFELDLLPNDGRQALSAIFNETTAGELMTELDVYWLKKADEDPADWIKRYHERTPLIHLKDMTPDEEGFFAELGTGGVDIEEITKLSATQKIDWWIIEQDVSRRDPLESIEISINYLKEIM